MPFNGSGTFNRVYNWTNDANNGINILSSRMDTEDSGFATGLSNVICKDGQTTVTANLPMATFKHLAVGNATARNQYLAAGQQQDGSIIWGGTGGGTAAAITISLTPAITAYATGQGFAFISGNNSVTGGTTININGVGTTAIKKVTSGGLSPIDVNDMKSGNVYQIIYDGTQFQLVNSSAPISYVSYISTTGSQTFTTPKNSSSSTVYKITLVGGGAGGDTGASGGGGGGSGASIIWYVSGLTANTGYTTVIGTGGAAASNGVATTFAALSCTMTAGGGNAGAGAVGGNGGAPSTSGGSPTNYILCYGNSATHGISSTLAGTGAGSILGGGRAGAGAGNTNGGAGLNYGSGGGGATGSGTGGSGFQGIAIIEWVL